MAKNNLVTVQGHVHKTMNMAYAKGQKMVSIDFVDCNGVLHHLPTVCLGHSDDELITFQLDGDMINLKIQQWLAEKEELEFEVIESKKWACGFDVKSGRCLRFDCHKAGPCEGFE